MLFRSPQRQEDLKELHRPRCHYEWRNTGIQNDVEENARQTLICIKNSQLPYTALAIFFMQIPLPQYHICISNRSKLRAERTKKSLMRNSRVLSSFVYIAYNQ